MFGLYIYNITNCYVYIILCYKISIYQIRHRHYFIHLFNELFLKQRCKRYLNDNFEFTSKSNTFKKSLEF